MNVARIIGALSLSIWLVHPSWAQKYTSNASEVSSVEINPLWRGSQKESPPAITLTRSNTKGFTRRWLLPDGTAAQDEVTEEAIRPLIRALQAPAITRRDLMNLGYTPQRLAQLAEEDAKHAGYLGEGNDERQQALFRRSLEDSARVQRLLPGVIAERWTDDGAWVKVIVVFSGGNTWSSESSALTPFMLPWQVDADSRESQTFNANISRAVADLLPASAANRDRIAGLGLDRLIVSSVAESIRSEWLQIGAEDQAGAALGQIRKRYTIRRSEVSGHQGFAFSTPPGGLTLEADVRLPGFPSNLVVATTFPMRDGKALGVDNFLSTGVKYEDLVLRNPWLMKSLRAHPDLGAWLIFDFDSSFTDKAWRLFVADMHEIGKDNLVPEVESHRADLALLNFYGNQLILFPDHHAIIWRWGKYRPILDWNPPAITTKRCSDFNTVPEGCAGAAITANGEVEK